MIDKDYSLIRYDGDSIKTVFTYDFDTVTRFGDSQVKVLLKNKTTGTVRTLSQNIDYDLDLDGKTVTMKVAPAMNNQLIICRNLPYIQDHNFKNLGLSQKETIEASDDYRALCEQQIKDGIPELLLGYDGISINKDLAEGQKILAEKLAELNQAKIDKTTVPNVITDINMQVSGDSAELILELKNTDTGEASTLLRNMPMASEVNAGIMPKESFAQINKNTADIAAHDGLLTYLPGNNFNTATPSQTDLNNYALSAGKTQPFPNSLAVRNLYDGVEWIYNAADDQWIPYGQGDVAVMTNDSLGIGKGGDGIRVGNDGSINVFGKALEDLSNASMSSAFQSLLRNYFAARDLDNLSDIGENKFVKRTIFKPTTINWTGELPIGSSTSPGVSNITVDITLDNLPAWFDFTKEKSFIELDLNIRIYANSNPTVNQLPYGQYIAVSYNVNSSYLEEYNTSIIGICKLTAGMGLDTSNLICQINNPNPKINLTLYNPSSNDSIRYIVDIKKATVYQYPV